MRDPVVSAATIDQGADESRKEAQKAQNVPPVFLRFLCLFVAGVCS